jgi:hypothetical protein
MAKQNKNNLFWFRSHKLLTLISLLILLLFGFFGWQAYEKHQNKIAFQEARDAIDEVYKDIVAKVGPPAKAKRDNECSRPNHEFTQGRLSCSVSTSFIYGVEDLDEANKKYRAIQSVIKDRSDLFKNDGPWSSQIIDEVEVNSYYHAALDKLKTTSAMRCTVNYVYDTPREMDLSVDNTNKGLETSIVCSDLAKAQYYLLQL